MTNELTPNLSSARLERSYAAAPQLIWELMTTAAGLEQWWAPEGSETRVHELDLTPGGQLRYTMTAIGPDQVTFMRSVNAPLANDFCKTFTEIAPPTRLAYRTLIDFVPDHEPYEHLTVIDVVPEGDHTRIVMTLGPLHDEGWTQQHRAHRNQELDHLGTAIKQRTS